FCVCFSLVACLFFVSPLRPSLFIFLFVVYCSAAHRDLHSFPTRRSSDLGRGIVLVGNGSQRWDLHSDGCDGERDYESEEEVEQPDRKSTRLNSSHVSISYAVFCLKKKK